MYTKEKILSLSSTISPFPKNLSKGKEREQSITLSSAHKNCFVNIVINNGFESDSNDKEVAVEDHKEVNYDRDYIIQLKWLHFKQMSLLIIVLHNSIKFYSEENELLLSSEYNSEGDTNRDNSYGRGIAALNDCIIFVGSNNGSIFNFHLTEEKRISKEKKSMETKHIRPITDLVSNENQTLISCDDCGKICVWDYNNNTKELDLKMIFDGFDDSSCNCLALYKNWLCGGYGSGHIRIFDLSLKTLVCEISAHSKWITGLDVAHKSGLVLSISEDSFVRVWHISEQNDSIKVSHKFSENIVNHMLFGGLFLDSSGDRFCVAGYDSKQLHCFKAENV